MKRLFFSVLLIIAFIGGILAQSMQQLPIDPKVRKGKLDNGLTYIIRHNELPKGQAEFYIAQKVGSILEDDNQQGLAHFLEHMCFNGTKNFPDKSMIKYLESIGVKFGSNLNAYTSIDETVYNISSVPVSREGVADSCLLILHDWACALTLDPKEIDAERGVIHEEWRTRSSAGLRLLEKAMPVVLQNSKYAYRLPIGKMEIVDNFPYKALRDYYEKWYRPDQQGIIVVGDIDVDKIEATIKKLFGSIKMPKNAAPRTYVQVADNEETIYSIVKDKEQTSTNIDIFYKYNPMSEAMKGTTAYYTNNYIKGLILGMLNSRLSEILMKPDAPYLSANINNGDFILCRTKSAYTASVSCKENQVEKGVNALLTEIQRAKNYGFTESEFERAVTSFVTSIEQAYKEKDKTTSSRYVDEYVQSFINNEPIPGIEVEHQLLLNLAKNISLADINKVTSMLFGESNRVVMASCPDKAGVDVPTKEMLEACFNKAKGENVTAYEDKVSNEPLLSKLPKAGKIIKKEKGKYESTIYYLSNGAKVIIKPTDFKADEISFTAFSPGGSSQFTKDEAVNIRMLNDVANLGGYGNFDPITLGKMLTGKKASASVGISSRTEEASGSCIGKDFETMMQLLYLKFTSPRKDMDLFNIFKSNIKIALEKQKGQPQTAFRDSMEKAIYMDHPLAKSLTTDMIDKIDYDRILQMYHDRFKDASDFTFIFIGNIDEKSMLPLIQTYIGGLPSTHRKESAKDVKLDYREGVYTNIFNKKMETPKASVSLLIHGDCDYNQKNLITVNILSQILNNIYLDEIREKESGTYGVQVGCRITQYPKGKGSININFDTNSDVRERITKKVTDLLNEFTAADYKVESIQQMKEFMLKNHASRVKENGYWMNILNNYYQNNIDMYQGYEQIVNSITVDDVKSICKKIIDQHNQINVTMWDK